MQQILYEYLVLHHQLPLPGIGTIYLKWQSSSLDIGNKQFLPPVYYYTLETSQDKASKKLYDWMESVAGFDEWDAIKKINEFVFDVKSKISSQGEMIWENVGIIKRNEAGSLELVSSENFVPALSPVMAEKVTRENVQHTILVGEQEKSSAEMETLLAVTSPSKDVSWVVAVILAVISFMFIGWYFSEKGFSTTSTGNQSIIHPK